MTTDIQADDIETTLAAIDGHYPDFDPFERVFEAIIEADGRRVKYIYDLNRSDDTTTLDVSAEYYDEGLLVNQSDRTQSFELEDGDVRHAGRTWDLQTFVTDNAFADPEISLTDEYESMI